ncbi:MAG: hypothetical protein KDA27_09215 [Candidatus Eisenbacteria bacterium]|uniref:Uncharacterized protein n=1 Tax=Eiseniibacteriota bacterium TaxID=2212470 RepID=A0A956NBL9_UNCEI|nr:hypothetical protein [Candidatus Eisenbacteria bacterium]MCB9466048.1 hypothetical protein [Candidatus Eisenbacteria bacterium]
MSPLEKALGTARAAPFVSSSRTLLLLLPYLLSIGLGCSTPAESDPKDTVPSDHDVSYDGALHKPGGDDPYAPAAWCADPRCHHVDLEGGWSLIGPTHDALEHDFAPSCYQCHGVLWQTRYPDAIHVLTPTSGDVWRHGTSRAVEWWGPLTDSVQVSLYRGSRRLEVLRNGSFSGGVIRIEEVSPSWGSGDGFWVQVKDSENRVGIGATFQICAAHRPSILLPDASTVLAWGDELLVTWDCAAGVVIDLFVLREGNRVGVLRMSAGNTGSLIRLVPDLWGTGDQYQVELVDGEGNHALSESFRIAATSR